MAPADSSPGPVTQWSRFIAALLATSMVVPLVLRAAPAVDLTQLQEVRFWSAGEVTRVALETSGEVRFKFDRLKSPDRVYVDLYDTVPKGSKTMQTIAVGDSVVKQIRYALSQKTVTRVVIDLEAEVEISTSQLSNPDRVMIELRRAAETPAASAAPVPSAGVRATYELPSPVRPVKARRQGKPFVAPAPVPAGQAPVLLADVGRLPVTPAIPLQRMSVSRFLRPAAVRLTAPPAPVVVSATKVEAAKRAPIPPPVVTTEPAPAEVRVASPAQRDRTGNRSLTRVLGLKLGRVVLDAGHGGHDTGTITRSGLMEKELVLDVTLRLGRLIQDRQRAEVIYTRADDTFIPLEKRALIANEKQADLFLSIHANSSPIKGTVGTETFYLNFTSSKADMDVAARENAGSEKSMHELSDLLRKIALKDKKDESREFADRIQAATYDFAARTHGKIRNRGVKTAPFVVLIGAEMPGVLTEIGFMSNSREEALLKKSEHRESIAEALFKGIVSYTESLSNFRVAQRQ